jgi:hypothetical protein
MASVSKAPAKGIVSVCDLAKDSAPRDKSVKVRGVLYCGLTQQCPGKCTDPFIWLMGAPGARESPFDEWAKVEYSVESDARKTGKRFEIWATVEGRLETRSKHPFRRACDQASGNGYGHLGASRAQILVERITDIEVKENPQSPYATRTCTTERCDRSAKNAGRQSY